MQSVVLIEMALLWTCFVFVLWALEGTEEYTAAWWVYQCCQGMIPLSYIVQSQNQIRKGLTLWCMHPQVVVAVSFSVIMMVQYDYFTGLQSLGKDEAPRNDAKTS